MVYAPHQGSPSFSEVIPTVEKRNGVCPTRDHRALLKFPTSKTRSKLYTRTAVTRWLPKHKQSTCQVTWQVDCLYIDNLRLRAARVSQKSFAEWPTQAGRAGIRQASCPARVDRDIRICALKISNWKLLFEKLFNKPIFKHLTYC